MKTPDEIKKGLEIAVNGCMTCDRCITECPYDLECHPTNEDTNVDLPKQMAADAIAYIQQLEHHIGELTEKVAQLEAAQPKWISVEERLPNVGEEVMVCGVKNGMQFGAFRGLLYPSPTTIDTIWLKLITSNSSPNVILSPPRPFERRIQGSILL